MASELKHAIFVSTGNLIAPRGGSELRTATLAREFAAAGVRTEVWCYVARNYPAETRKVTPNLTVRQRHLAWLDAALAANKLGLAPATDLAGWLKHGRKSFARRLHAAAPDVVIFTFPWFAAWQEAASGITRVYDAHNVETDYWAPVLLEKRGGKAALERLREWERRAVAACERLVTCTEADGSHFREMGLGDGQSAVVPNGFDLHRIPVRDAETHIRARRGLGIAEGERMALFMGRGTGPNKQAVEQIVGLQPKLLGMGVRLFVVGCAGDGYEHLAGDGLTITGEVESMEPYLQAADVGINPMMSGSGSNLKLAEFAAAGLEIVTTEFGLRGYEDWRPYVKIVESDENWVSALNARGLRTSVPAAALEAYSWPRLAVRMMKICEETIGNRNPKY